jgi:ABC-type multidrug transport system fused ATPase/permease subunit
MSSVAIEQSAADAAARPKRRRNTDFWRACRFLAPYRGMVAASIACAFLAGLIMTSGIGALYPILQLLTKGGTIRGWVDARLPQTPAGELPWHWQFAKWGASLVPEHPVAALAVIFLAIAVLTMVGNVVRFIHEFYSDKAVISAINDIRKNLYDHVLHIPLGFFGLKGTSDVTSRLVGDCQALQDGLKIVLGQGVLEPIRATLALGLAMLIDWRLTLFIVVCAPVMGVVIKKFGKKMRRASRAALQSNSTLLGQIESTLIGIRVVKAASAERLERRRFTGILDGLRREQMKMARYEALSTPVMETMALWIAGAVLIFASYLMFVKRSLDASQLVIIMACLVSMGEALRRISKLNTVLQRSNAAAARVFETMDVPTERHRPSAPRAPAMVSEGSRRFPVVLPPIQRDVRFEGVMYSYPNSSAPAVVDVDLVVPRGRSIAIVGRNGSGKTTLLALLPRFYDPERGRITIDGIDIHSATLRSLRRQIGIVTQDSVIFPGTIAENIAYGMPLATREQIEAAARRAFAHEFIMEKPLGYDAPLDGLGGQLSGGQKQRLNIARAILRQAPILILDEATSQVDAESEHLIQQAIEGLMHERTTFVIAHRFSTILSADQIVVMDRGRIVGQGQHDELLKSCQTYQQLYERQLVGAAG